MLKEHLKKHFNKIRTIKLKRHHYILGGFGIAAITVIASIFGFQNIGTHAAENQQQPPTCTVNSTPATIDVGKWGTTTISCNGTTGENLPDYLTGGNFTYDSGIILIQPVRPHHVDPEPKGGETKTYQIKYKGLSGGTSTLILNRNVINNNNATAGRDITVNAVNNTNPHCDIDINATELLVGSTATGKITCSGVLNGLNTGNLDYANDIIEITQRGTGNEINIMDDAISAIKGNGTIDYTITFKYKGISGGDTAIEISGTNATNLGIQNTESETITVIEPYCTTIKLSKTSLATNGTGTANFSCYQLRVGLTSGYITHDDSILGITTRDTENIYDSTLVENERGEKDPENPERGDAIGIKYTFTYKGIGEGTGTFSITGQNARSLGISPVESNTITVSNNITCSINVSKEDITIDGTGTVTITCKGLDESPYVDGTRDITYTPRYIDLSFSGCRRDDKDYKCSYNYTGKTAGTSEITLKSNSVFGNTEAISYEGGIKVHEKTTCNVHVSNTGIKEGGTGIATITCNGTIYASTLYEEDIEMNTHIINAGVEPRPTGHSQETNIIIERGAQHLYTIPYTGRAVGESTFNLRANVMGNNEGATGDTIYVRANTTEYTTICERQTETEQVEVGKTGNITLTCNQENLPEVNLRDIITIRSINGLVQPEINQIIEVGQTQIDIRNNEAETTTYILSFTGTQTGNVQLTISGTKQIDKDTTYTFTNGKSSGNIEVYEKGGMGSAPKCTIEGETPVALNNNGTITVSCSGDNLGFYSEDSMKAINALTYGRKIEVKNAPEIRDSNDNITLIYGFTGTEEGTTILKLNNNVITNGGIPNVEVQGNDIEITNNITSCTWGDGDTSILKDHTGSMNLSCPQSIKIDALKPMISPLNTNILTVTDVTQEGNEGGNRIYKVTYEGNNTGTTKLTINGTYNGQTYTQTRPSDDITVIDDTPFDCKINVNPTQNTVGGNGTIQITCDGQEYAEEAQKNWLEYNEEIIDVSTWGTQNGNEVTFTYTGRNPGLSHVKLKTGVIHNTNGVSNNPVTGDDIKIYYTGICTWGEPEPATITTGERGTITLTCPKGMTGFANQITIGQSSLGILITKAIGDGPTYTINYTGVTIGTTKLSLDSNVTAYIHLSDNGENSKPITVIGKDKPKCTIDISHTVIPRNRTGLITVTCSGTNRENLSNTGIDYDQNKIILSPITPTTSNGNKIYTMTYTGKEVGYTQFGIKTGAISAGTISNDYIQGDDIIVIGTGRIICGRTTPNPQDIETEGTGKIYITGCNFGGLSYSELVDRIDPYIISLVETKNERGIVNFSTGRRLTDNIIYRGIGIGSTHFIIDGEINEYVSVQAEESEQINVYKKVFAGCTRGERISPIGIGVTGHIDLICTGIEASSEINDQLWSVIQFSPNGKINTGTVEHIDGKIRFHYSGKEYGTTRLTASGQSEGYLYHSNQSDPIIVTNAKPTCSISLNPTSRTSGTVTLTLTSSNATKYSRTGFENMVTSIGTKTVSTNGTYTGYVQNAAGNTGFCTGKVSIIDKTKPTVSFNKESGNAASSHTVKVTANDANAGLKSSQKIKYRWQTEETCSTIASQYSTGATLSPTTAGTKTASGNVTTPSNLTDGAYYLCIMGGSISDRAGNTNDVKRSTGTFIIDRTAPDLPTCTANQNACFSGEINVSCTIEGNDNTIHYTTDGSNPTCNSATWNTNLTFTGDTILKVTACDSSNNYSGYNPYTYQVDNRSPDDSKFIVEPEYTQGLSNTIESEPAQGRGCDSTTYYQYCKNTTNSTNSCTGTNISSWSVNTGTTFNNLIDGQIYYYFVRTKDGLGNTNERSGSTHSTQDNTAPVIELSGSGTPNIIKSGTAVTIYIKITDTVSGIDTGEFEINDLSFKVGGTNVTPGTKTLTWQSTNNGVSIYKLVLNKILGNGALTITIADNAIEDNVGNSSTGSTLDPNVTVDNTAPTLSFIDNVTGNYVTGDIVTVSRGDAAVTKYKYTTSTCNTTESSYTTISSTDLTQTTQANNGKYICLFAKDNAGNIKTLRSANKIHIDTTAPEGGSISINDGAQHTNNANVTLNITCATDALEGTVLVAYGESTEPTNWTECIANEDGEMDINYELTAGDGDKTVYVRFKDGLDNTSEEITNTINVNTTAINISATNAGSWKKSNISIKLNATAGAPFIYKNYSRTGLENCINSGTPFTGGDTISYSTEGTKTLYLCAKDESNQEATRSGKYMLDKTKPTVTFDKESGGAAHEHEIIVTAKDEEYSKLAANPEIRYKRETNSTCSTTASEYTILTLNATAGTTSVSGIINTDELDDGTYQLCILAGKTKDRAGNTNSGAHTNGTFTVDNTAPVGGSFKINNDATYTTGINVTLNTICPTDAGEGTVQVAYGTGENPANWTTCSEDINFTLPSGDGTKSVYMKFKDGLGNTTENTEDTIILDSVTPEITFNKNSGSTAKTHSVKVIVSDTTSKLDANQKIKYKWTTDTDCGTEGFTEELELGPTTAGTQTASGIVKTPSDLPDGAYLLCILGGTVSDQAGNKNIKAQTSGRFIIDNTPPQAPTCTADQNACFNGMINVTCTGEAGTTLHYTTGENSPSCSSHGGGLLRDSNKKGGEINAERAGTQKFSETTILNIIACDSAGNASTLFTETYTLDNKAPKIPELVEERPFTQGLSNIIESNEVNDIGCNGQVEYQFCKIADENIEFCNRPENQSDWTNAHETKFTNLIDGTEYYYYVRSRDGLGNTSEWNKTPVSSTQDASAPIITIENKNGIYTNNSETIEIKIQDHISGIEPNEFNSGDLIIQVGGNDVTSIVEESLIYKGETNGTHTYSLSLQGLTGNGDLIIVSKSGSVEDNVGNKNEEDIDLDPSIKVDTIKPVCTINEITKQELSTVVGYNTGKVTINCTDTGAGISTMKLESSAIEYEDNVLGLDNLTTGTITNGISYTFIYTAEHSGSTTFQLKTGMVSDRAGNLNDASDKSGMVIVSTDGPAEPTCTPTNACFRENVNVSCTGVEGTIHYTTNGNTPTCDSPEWIDTTFNETTTLKIIACDGIGNNSIQKIYEYKLDTSTPNTTHSNIPSGWTGNNVSISLTATDEGCDSNTTTYYCVANSGDTCTPTTQGTNVAVSCDEGTVCEKYVRYYSKDGLGNTESTQETSVIKIDKKDPVCGTITYTPNTWTNGNVTGSFTASDQGAGLQTASPQTLVFTDNGTGNVTFTDKVGNSITCEGEVTKIDKNEPTVSFSSQSGVMANSHNVVVTVNDTEDGLRANQNVQYKWTAETTCGTDGYTTKALNPTTLGATTATVEIDTAGLIDGSYYLCIKSGTVTDQAGNTNAEAKTIGVFVVKNNGPVAPTCTPDLACFSGNIAVSCTASEGTIHYTTDETTPTCSSSTWNTNQTFTGDTTLKVIACDSIGNTSLPNTYTYTKDTSTPSTTHSNIPSGWTGNNVSISLTATDEGCDSNTTTYYCVANNGDTCTPTTQGTNVAVSCDEGTVCEKYVRYYSKDGLGNTESTKETSVIKIDKSNPTGEIITTYPSGVLTNRCTSGAITLTLSGTDTNGLNARPYKRNNGDWTGNATMTLTNNGYGTGYIRDAAGNITGITYNITGISMSGPDIFLDSPYNGRTLTGLVNFEWHSTADDPICQAIDGGYTIVVYSGTEIIYTGNTTDTSKETTLSDGTYTWNVSATDILGHTSTGQQTRTLIINKQAPICDIDYIPGSGSKTSGDVLAILTGCTEGTTGFNTTGTLFTGNTTYTFTFINELGVTGNAIANVRRIDKEGPILSGITSIGTTTDNTPDYTFSSTESGTIAYSGACSSTTTGATSGNNTITLNTLSVGTYSGCTITVTDELGNISNTLTIPEFTIRSQGGNGGTLKKDNCPDGDYSDSYYDGTCKGSHNSDRTRDLCKVDESRYPDEMKLAYIYSYVYGMTTMCPINDADLYGYLRRDHLAKILSQYAINVLDLEPEAGKKGCTSYNDIANESAEMKYYMKTACELGLMGLESDGDTPMKSFYPHGLVSRAEFGTTLSRLIYGDAYNLDSEAENSYPGAWYGKHLAALKRDEIMTEIYGDRPQHLELRGYVMLMVMRHGKGRLNIETNTANPSIKTGSTQSTSSNTNTINNSDVLSIYNRNKELTCNFTFTSGTEYSTGIIYANNNKLKQVNNEVRPEKSRDYLLVNNKKVYVRGDGFDTGYGVVFDYTGNVYDDIKEISESKEYKLTNCKNTVESNSVFNIPSNVTFITFAELLEEMFTAMFKE